MYAIPIGLSTLSAAERALDVIGQNVANSATPGYHRQTLDLVDRVYDGVHGAGVVVGAVNRNIDDLLHGSVLATGSQDSLASTRLDIEQQVQSSLTTAAIDTRINDFFNQVSRLTVNPADLTQRRTVL